MDTVGFRCCETADAGDTAQGREANCLADASESHLELWMSMIQFFWGSRSRNLMRDAAREKPAEATIMPAVRESLYV